MANFLSNTKPANGVQLGIYTTRVYGGDNYFHYKTNLTMSNVMCMIEAVGYSYGANAAIRSSWCFYPYSGTNSIINDGLSNTYGGLTAHGIYKSADGYVVIRAYCPSYYSGWVLNAYTVNPGGYNSSVSISASVQTSNSGNYY